MYIRWQCSQSATRGYKNTELISLDYSMYMDVCFSFQHCIMALCSSSFSELGLQLLTDLLSLRDCSYWLVRNELLETLAEVDFR